MKVAITADLHLTTKTDHPERFNALEDILRQCNELEANLLIIAGDLFDQGLQNFADFEATINESAPENFEVIVTPGNHDPETSSKSFTLKNLTVISKPKLHKFENCHLKFLFIPFVEEHGMGEELAPFEDELPAGEWVLIGHGDWAAGMISPDPYEKGVYMPLTRIDLNTYQPAEVFLGHVHVPYDEDPIHYPGSPCPMDITETGPRRFLIFNTETQQIEEHTVKSDMIYFNERFVLLPVENEEVFIRNLVSRRIESWQLPEELKDRVVIRARFSGYVSDRSRVQEIAEEMFAKFRFYEDKPPDLSELNTAMDSDKIHIARQVEKWHNELNWRENPREPSRDDILIEALKVIYGT